MPRLLRIALQVVIMFMVLAAVIGVASGSTGVAEKAVLVAIGLLLVWLATLLRRPGRPASPPGNRSF